MKKISLISLIGLLILSAFVQNNIYTDLNLTREELSERLLEELSSDYPRSEFCIETYNYGSGIYLNVAFDQFTSLPKSKYNSKMLAVKAEIMDILQSPEFREKWITRLRDNGMLFGENREDIAANRTRYYLEELYNEIPSESVEIYLENFINDVKTQQEQIKKEKNSVFISDSELVKLKNNKYLNSLKLKVMEAAYNKRDLGTDSMRSAYKSLVHFNDVFDRISDLRSEIESINVNTNNFNDRQRAIAQKQDMENRLAPYYQVLDKLKLGIKEFDKAYFEFRSQQVFEEEIKGYSDTDILQIVENSSPYLKLTKLLTNFVEASNDIDFAAKLDENKQFITQEYEWKSRTWKFCYRRGEKFTNTARKITKKWIEELSKKQFYN